MGEMNNQRLWFDYIAKINDRKRQKDMASGFTAWAILGVLCYLINEIIDKLFLISQSSNFFSLLFFCFTTIFNVLYFGIILILSGLLLVMDEQEARIGSRLKKMQKPLYAIPIIFLSAIMGCCNLIVAIQQEYAKNSRWVFISISSVFIVDISFRLLSFFKNKIKHTAELKLPDITSSSHNRCVRLSIAMLIIALPLLIISIIPAYNSLNYISNKEYIDILKASFYIILIILLITIGIFKFTSTFEDYFYSRLEQKIVLNDLHPEEIKKLYVEEIIGVHVQDLLKRKEQELTKSYNNIIELSSHATLEIDKINNISEEYKFEKSERKKQISDKLEGGYTQYGKLQKELIQWISHLIEQLGIEKAKSYFDPILNNIKSQAESLAQMKKEIQTKLKEIK